MARDPVGDPQGAGEEGALRLLDLDQAAGDERAAATEAPPGGRVGRGGAAQLERQADLGAAAGDVVVEVGIEALEARVQVGRERDQQQVEVERVEAEAARQPAQAQFGAGPLGAPGGHLDRGGRRGRDGRRARRSGVEQPVDLLVGEVEAAEGVVGTGVGLAAQRHRGPHRRLHQRQPPAQVDQAGLGPVAVQAGTRP